MKIGTKMATRALGVLAAGGLVLGSAVSALASAPTYEPDPGNELGSIVFYDATGHQVTSGTISDAPFATYAVATTDDPVTSNTKATLYGALPQQGVNPGLWTSEQMSSSTTFPATTAPAAIAAAGTHRPVVTLTASTTTLQGLQGDLVHQSGDPYAGLYQLRILTSGNSKYWAADVQITNNTWTLVYPTIATSSLSLSESPHSQTVSTFGGAGSDVTLTATAPNNSQGSVAFTDTDTNSPIGTAQTLPGSATNNAVSVTATAPATGTHHYQAMFTPAAGQLFTSTTSSSTYVVSNPAADTTNTSLSAPAFTAGQSETFTSTVTDTTHSTTAPAGSVSWYEGATKLAGPVTLGPDAQNNNVMTAQATDPNGFGLAAGPHTIVARFTSSDARVGDSQSQPVTVTVSPAAGDPCNNTGGANFPNDPRANTCTDQQNEQVTVPTGGLLISTPYTSAQNAFDLGTLTLSGDGTFLHTSAPFGTDASPAAGVTVTDTRSGNLPWTAAVTSTDFTHGSDAISACNLGFVGVHPNYLPGNALNASNPVTASQNSNGVAAGDNTAAADPTKIAAAGSTTCTTGLTTNGLAAGSQGHEFAAAAAGDGTVYLDGVMDLYAPTSTPPGLYTGVLTFTVFG